MDPTDYLPDDDDTVIQRRIVEELKAELELHVASGEPLSPAVRARGHRSVLEGARSGFALAEEHRRLLRERAAAGDESAIAVLALLADDPFWREG